MRSKTKGPRGPGELASRAGTSGNLVDQLAADAEADVDAPHDHRSSDCLGAERRGIRRGAVEHGLHRGRKIERGLRLAPTAPTMPATATDASSSFCFAPSRFTFMIHLQKWAG